MTLHTKRIKWTVELAMEKAKGCDTKTAFSKTYPRAYVILKKADLLDKALAHTQRPKQHNFKYTKEILQEISAKYNRIIDWVKGHNSSYLVAKKTPYFNELVAHMSPKYQQKTKVLTQEHCLKQALKYSTIKDWRKNDSGSYQEALKNKWIPQFTAHMQKLKAPNGYWQDVNVCKKEALKYISVTEWQQKSIGSYASARKNDWLKECTAHMQVLGGTSKPEQSLLALIKQKYPKAQTLRIRDKTAFKDKPYIQGFDIDIYIPELRKGIEFNGNYWHSVDGLKRGRNHWPKQDLDEYHQLKEQFFKSRKIEYITIKESDWVKNKSLCLTKIDSFLTQP